MSLYAALLRGMGRGLLGVAFGGLAADVLCDVLPEAAQKVYEWWRGKSPEERRAEVEALAQAPAAEVNRHAAAIAAELLPEDREGQKQLSLYLSLVPNAVRASLRRPVDPLGRSVPAGLDYDSPDSVLSLLPSHLPRFRAGDRPLPGIDWELDELLGAGGFGEVWRAKNPHFDAVPPVALKFCLDPAAKDRLLRHEAAILNQVMRQGKHPGIVALQHTYLSADPPCLEYEYVGGGDLGGLLHQWQSERPDPERAARMVLELARIVAFAHGLTPAIVHRDLKPANVLIDTEGKLRVADFGIGQVAANRAIARTARGVSQGAFLVTALRGAHTPMYASPQQMRGEPADPRDDVFALGVIWYQLLGGGLTSGRPGGTRWMGKLVAAGVARELVDLMAECLEDDPQDRPRDAGALADALAKKIEPPPRDKPPLLLGRPVPPPVPAPVPAPVVLPATWTNSQRVKFALIPAGSFLMGSPAGEAMRLEDEGPVRLVRVERAFYLGVHTVTQREYEAVMGKNPAAFKRKSGGGPEHPVEMVSWEEAMNFCRRLAELEGKPAGAYFLPSEEQWEYACRAGTLTPFSIGDALSSREANFDGNRPYGAASVGPFLERTAKVGSYRANGWGLYDMHGNVWEWCDGGTRVARPVRGGSWNNSGHLCRSARRQSYAATFRGETVGFRVALMAE